MEGKKDSVARRLAGALSELGVRHVFGVPSGGWIDYLEAIRTTDGIQFVLTAHEGCAAFMASVYGRLSGVPGVCFGTLGPGATNLSTGVGCALLDRCPLIALSDEIPAAMHGRTVQMGIDHQALFRPLTKHTTRLEPERVERIIEDAARLAMAERPGPVHIGLPVGLSAETGVAHPFRVLPPATCEPHEEAALKALASALAAATRPLLAVGLGAVRARVGEPLVALAERLCIPVVLTPMAKGLIAESHPCYAGVLFHALGEEVAATYRQADLILAVGYDPVEFSYESWVAPQVPLFSIDTVTADIDPERIRLTGEAIGDIGTVLDCLIADKAGDNDWDLNDLAARRQRMFSRMAPHSGYFGPCAALEVLREVLPDEGIMTCDVGAHTHLIGQKWSTPHPDTLIMSNGWSSMGFAIPAAIAAALCRPGTPVCAVVGDGGLLMSAGELATAAREQLAIVIVVLNDHDLALIRIKQQRKGNPLYGTSLRPKGSIGQGHVFGVPLSTAATAEEFEQSLRAAFKEPGPVIVEALIDGREYDQLVLREVD